MRRDQERRKIVKKTSIVLISVLLLCLIAWFVVVGIMVFGVSAYIFSDMEECKSIASADGSFSEYADASSDKNNKGLTYTDFFAGKYDSGDFKFEIFAYEFDSVDSARAYFKEVTGKNSRDRESNFTLSSGLLSSRACMVVFNNNLAYIVYMPTMDIKDATDFLSEVFSIKIA